MTRKRILLLAGAAFLSCSLFYVLMIDGTHVHDRHRLAQLQIEIVGAAVDQYRADLGEYPPGLEQLIEPFEPGTTWLGPYTSKRHLHDPWGRSLYYRVEDDGRSYVLFTLGKDGRVGGGKADADLGAHSPEQIHPVAAER